MTKAEMDLDEVFSSDTDDEAAGRAKALARVEAASSLKEDGNRLLQKGSTVEAATVYRRALSSVWALYKQRSCPEAVSVGTAIDLNLALCHLRCEEWEAAQRCASRAIEASGQNAKGLFRRGVAAARLGQLDAAEADLAAAASLQPGTDVRRELARVREQLASMKGSSRALARGFLHGQSLEGDDADGTSGEQDDLDGESGAPQDSSNPAHDPEPVAAAEVLSALEEVSSYLAAIAERRIVCDSDAQLAALREQMERAAGLMHDVRAVVEGAAVTQAPPGAVAQPVDVAVLLERMAAGLGSFRPFFQLEESCPGEFDSLRVCRELPRDLDAGRSAKYGFDLELVLWGQAEPATAEDFASPLFGPTGRPPDAEAAAWQRAAFHRVFQKDASKHVAGAAWLVLREFLDRGVELRLQGRRILDLGLAHGFFFQDAAPFGPPSPGCAAAVADAMAICLGKDRRLVVVHSFTSLGLVHNWLSLLVDAPGEGEGPPQELAVDLCAGALGILEQPCKTTVRLWEASSDGRFLPRCVRWGDEAWPLSHGPQSKRPGMQVSALKALLAHAACPFSAEELMAKASITPASADDNSVDVATDAEAGRRLFKAVRSLGLCCGDGGLDELDGCPGQPTNSKEFEALQRAAVEELVQQKLRNAGLAKQAAARASAR